MYFLRQSCKRPRRGEVFSQEVDGGNDMLSHDTVWSERDRLLWRRAWSLACCVRSCAGCLVGHVLAVALVSAAAAIHRIVAAIPRPRMASMNWPGCAGLPVMAV